MIRLHHVPQSRSMRTLWLLHELGLEFEVQNWPFDKTLRSSEYLALHPAGRVPALEIDGRVLWETGAITEYLCERFPQRGLGRAMGDLERADWLIWVHFSETMTQHGAALTQQHVALYKDDQRSAIVMKLEAKRIEKCYAAIEARLEARTYLLSEFSAADVSVGQAIYMCRHFAKIEAFVRLSAWYERITERDAFKSSLPNGPEEHLYRQEFYEAWDV